MINLYMETPNKEWQEALYKKNFIPIFDMPMLHSGMSLEEFLNKTKKNE